MTPLKLVIKHDCLDKLKADSLWDSRYNLPTFPSFNNPWIYMAYCALLLKQNDERRAWREHDGDVKYYIENCEVDYGLLDRWPDGAGGGTSHDEIMGAAFLDKDLAARIVNRLHLERGRCDNKETDNGIADNEYRFIFLMPYLRACAGMPCGLIRQFMWCAHVIEHAFTHKLGDESGTLMIWLMLDVMERFILCRIVGLFWQWRMRKHGLNGVKTCFEYYLNDHPVLAEIAPTHF